MSENTQNTTQSANRSSRPRVIPHIAPSGQEIPVIVRPMSNGESANNVDILDMSAQVEPEFITYEEYKAIRKREKERENMSHFLLSFKPIRKIENQGGIRFKVVDGKKTDVALTDDQDNVLRYPSKYSIEGIAPGCTPIIEVSKEIYDSLELGETYLLKGRLGNVRSFGEERFTTIPESFEYL